MLYVAKIDGIKKEEELRVIRELAEKLNVENIEQKIRIYQTSCLRERNFEMY